MKPSHAAAGRNGVANATKSAANEDAASTGPGVPTGRG
jgi:hypothetical protein